jgi:hypothetical protein
MKKTIEAWLRGYVLFRVNEKWFLTYGRALAYRKAVPDDHDVSFAGWHLFKGWRFFFVRVRYYHGEARST